MKKTKRILSCLCTIVCILLLAIAFLCLFSAQWYVNVYGRLGFDSVLFTLSAGLDAVESDLIYSYLGYVLPQCLFWTGSICLFLFFRVKGKKLVLSLFHRIRFRLYPIHRAISALVAIVLSFCLIFYAAVDVELVDYLNAYTKRSTIFEEEYRDPSNANISFPEQKRNLIYIFLESMETSYLSTAQGGAIAYNLIPELTVLAENNVNFSHNDTVGGFYPVTGAMWTVGAMVSQSAGVPLKTPPNVGGNEYGQDGNFLPGIYTLNNVLHDNGYYQALMVGSDGTYGGRAQYYTQHGVDEVFDLYTAQRDGIIPEGYFVWWGMEDKYLYEYAKQELTEISQKDQPFAFTMLTVDTHHIGGYPCEYCENIYAEQYENVINCASRQIDAFIRWIQEQPFYENTTVVIVGDHTSMDNGYFKRVAPAGYQRTVYNCFINAAAEASKTTNRLHCAMDMFPTTLAALGCQIPGDRLGLGTNLFSDTPTLMEQMGYDAFDTALAQTSLYYTQNFFFLD